MTRQCELTLQNSLNETNTLLSKKIDSSYYFTTQFSYILFVQSFCSTQIKLIA